MTDAKQKLVTGAFLILMGVFILLAAFGIGPMSGSKMNAPRWVIGLCGLYLRKRWRHAHCANPQNGKNGSWYSGRGDYRNLRLGSSFRRHSVLFGWVIDVFQGHRGSYR